MAETQPVQATVLGSGTSTGVPVIGCRCEVCLSDDPKNHRSRASLMLSLSDGRNVVIDTAPEFRLQMLREDVRQLSQVIYTHTHADHCHGFDDLRAFYFHSKTPVECLIPRMHYDDFRARFAYAFHETGYLGTKPQVLLSPFDEKPFEVLGTAVEPAYLPHGNMTTACLKFGSFLYATDFKEFPRELVERWRGRIKVMVASGVHFRPHATHSNVPETVELFRELGVERGVITHLAHDVEYIRDSADLPPFAEFAYDGMKIDLSPSLH